MPSNYEKYITRAKPPEMPRIVKGSHMIGVRVKTELIHWLFATAKEKQCSVNGLCKAILTEAMITEKAKEMLGDQQNKDTI